MHSTEVECAYPIAPGGIFLSAQGEGALAGVPMAFVRLAGCQVACAGCDTDYSHAERLEPAQIRERLKPLLGPNVGWMWLTGGEPTEHDLRPLYALARGLGLKVALATAGTREVPRSAHHYGPDFLSVSPHALDATWLQRAGDQLNLVPGLGGLRLAGVDGLDLSGFTHHYVTPLADREGRPQGVRQCLEFVAARPGWRLGFQAHKQWGLP